VPCKALKALIGSSRVCWVSGLQVSDRPPPPGFHARPRTPPPPPSWISQASENCQATNNPPPPSWRQARPRTTPPFSWLQTPDLGQTPHLPPGFRPGLGQTVPPPGIQARPRTQNMSFWVLGFLGLDVFLIRAGLIKALGRGKYYDVLPQVRPQA
jgi:hypothetical protein